MIDLLQTLEGALTAAAIYLMVGLAWNIVYNAGGYLNLAVGEFFVLAGVLSDKAPEALGTDAVPVVAVVVVALVAAVAWGCERAFIRPLPSRGFTVILVTLGIALVLSEVVRRLAPELAVRPAAFFGGDPLNIGGVIVARQAIVILVVAAAMAAAMGAFLARTGLGRTFRACADDRDSARWLGIDLPRIETMAFVASAAIAAIAAVVAAPSLGVAAGSGELLAVKSFLAVSIGGIGSNRGAVVGALAVAVVESLVARYWSSDVKDLVVLAGLLAVLVAQPGRAWRNQAT